MKEDAQVIQALQGTVLLQVLSTDPASEELVKTHGVRSAPTFLMLDHRGEVLQSWIGYGDPADWSARVAEVKADPATLAARRARFETAPAFRDALVLGTNELRARSCRSAERYLRRAAELDPEAARKEAVPLKLFRVAVTGAETGEFTLSEATAVATALLAADDLEPEHALEIANTLAGKAGEAGFDVVGPLIEKARPSVEALPPDQFVAQRQQFRIHHALIVERDEARAVGLKKESLAAGWEEDPEELNGFAWWCFGQRVNLAEAEALAQRGVELSAPGSARADILDTLAELVNARGDREGAAALIREALTEDPENGYLRDQLTKFTEGPAS